MAVPPASRASRRGRPSPTHTKLGRLLAQTGMRAGELTLETGIYTRQLTEILAGRKPPSSRELNLLCNYYKLNPKAFVEDQYPWTPELRERQVELEEKQKKIDAAIEKVKAG